MQQQLKSLIMLLLLFNSVSKAQTESLAHKKKWYIPTGCSVEYAGGFGMLSAGALFTPFKKTELAVTTGYTPPEFGNIWTVNFLLSYSPINIQLTKKIAFAPLNIGCFTSFTFGDNIYIVRPSKYSVRYYWWNSSIRVGPFIEADLKYKLNDHHRSIDFFFQCLTNDLYLATYLPNTEHISFGDILVFGLGGKFNF